MLKKILSLVVLTLCFAVNVQAETIVKNLPQPNLSGGKPLLEVMKNRRSSREFANKPLSEQTLSEILWTAWGISHEDKHTIPTSMNKQNLQVYALLEDGAWLYNPKDNTLIQITAEDLRPIMAQQSYVTDAPLTLVYTGSDAKNSPLHAGSAYQNTGLYAASAGLNNVVRGYFDKAALAKALNLNEDEIIVSQTIGWPK